MPFTDSHCHLDFKEFSLSQSSILEACAKAGIHRIVIPAITPKNWQHVLELANPCASAQQTAYCKTYACLGIHPWFLEGLGQEHLNELALEVQKNRNNIVAIGETGIDGVIAQQKNNLAQQLAFFKYQLQLAKDHHLPIIIHHRRSHQHIIPLLKQASLHPGGIIHAFSGSEQEAKAYIKLGFKLGVGGAITYPRAQKTIRAIKRIPLSSLVLETDAPSMPLYGFQGQANSPLQLIKIFDALVEIRPETSAEVMRQLEENINAVFQFCPSPGLKHRVIRRKADDSPAG